VFLNGAAISWRAKLQNLHHAADLRVESGTGNLLPAPPYNHDTGDVINGPGNLLPAPPYNHDTGDVINGPGNLLPAPPPLPAAHFTPAQHAPLHE
jgi:hypothetical protein